MGNVCGSAVPKEGSSEPAKAVISSKLPPRTDSSTAKTRNGTADTTPAANDDGKGNLSNAPSSIQSIKEDKPGSISITVAPAPPPDEFPEIKAAVAAAQKEVKAGAKLKFPDHYRLGQVVGTGHYARVQLAMSLKDGKKYAVKIIKKHEGKQQLLQQLQGTALLPWAVSSPCTNSDASTQVMSLLSACHDDCAKHLWAAVTDTLRSDCQGCLQPAHALLAGQCLHGRISVLFSLSNMVVSCPAGIVKEVAIMHLLADHPNMVQLHQVLQDTGNFYLVMEHCNGGELFDQIIKSGHMTEAMAAAKAKQLISFLAHAHSKHVIHRYVSARPRACIKLLS